MECGEPPDFPSAIIQRDENLVESSPKLQVMRLILCIEVLRGAQPCKAHGMHSSTGNSFSRKP